MFFSVAKMLAVRAPFQGLRYPVSADKEYGNLQLILFSPIKMTKRQIAPSLRSKITRGLSLRAPAFRFAQGPLFHGGGAAIRL